MKKDLSIRAVWLVPLLIVLVAVWVGRDELSEMFGAAYETYDKYEAADRQQRG